MGNSERSRLEREIEALRKVIEYCWADEREDAEMKVTRADAARWRKRIREYGNERITRNL